MIIIVPNTNCKTVLLQTIGLKKNHNSLNLRNSMRKGIIELRELPEFNPTTGEIKSNGLKLDYHTYIF